MRTGRSNVCVEPLHDVPSTKQVQQKIVAVGIISVSLTLTHSWHSQPPSSLVRIIWKRGLSHNTERHTHEADSPKKTSRKPCANPQASLAPTAADLCTLQRLCRVNLSRTSSAAPPNNPQTCRKPTSANSTSPTDPLHLLHRIHRNPAVLFFTNTIPDTSSRQNNSRLDELANKVSALRGVTIDIYDNARDQHVIDSTVRLLYTHAPPNATTTSIRAYTTGLLTHA